MPIIILRPATTPGESWTIQDPPNPPRPATFGASKEINSAYVGNGTQVVLQATVGGSPVDALKLQVTVDGQTEKISTAGTLLGLQWWLGDGPLSAKDGVPDLPAEFEAAISEILYWTGTVNGGQATDGRAGKS